MHDESRVLRLHSYGNTKEEDSRVTFSSSYIKYLEATDSFIQERLVKKVIVSFIEGEDKVIFINELDLVHLESIVGMYDFFED